MAHTTFLNPTTLLTERDAADILGMSISWLQKGRWRGTGPKFIRIGGAIRYRLEDLIEYINRRTVETLDSENSD